MTQASRFWNTTGAGDGPSAGYGRAEIADWIRTVFGDGILAGVLNELAVSGSASPLSVATGAALVDGVLYRNTAALNVTVSTPSTGTTGGRIVLRADWTAQTIRAVAKLNTDGNASPPALTQTSGSTYEISLATFVITTGGVISSLVSETTRAAFATRLRAGDIGPLAALSVIGRTGSTSGAGQAIAASSDGQVLRRAAGAVGFGQLITASFPNDVITQAKIADTAVDAARLAAEAFAAEKIASESVDDTKAGAKTPQFIHRQGGSSSSWVSPGATTYDPGKVRIQAGSYDHQLLTGVAEASLSIAFPTPFNGSAPLIILSAIFGNDPYSRQHNVMIASPTSAGFVIRLFRKDTSDRGTTLIHWFAIGPR